MHGMTISMQPETSQARFLRRRIGTTAKAVMRLRGLTVAEVTRRSTWNQASKTSRLLNGQAGWTEDILVEIATILRIDVGMLFEPPVDALLGLGVPQEVADELIASLGKVVPGGDNTGIPANTGSESTKPGNSTRSNRTGPMRKFERKREPVPTVPIAA